MKCVDTAAVVPRVPAGQGAAPRRLRRRAASAGLVIAMVAASLASPASAWLRGLVAPIWQVHLPLVARAPAEGPPNIDEEYGTLAIEDDPETQPAAEHPDLNLAVRGYAAVDASRGLVDYGGAVDQHAPQLVDLLGRLPAVRGTYQVYDWDWERMARALPIASPAVTFITLAAGRYEIVRVPDSGRTIGDGYQALVLYADTSRITLKYTREDNVVEGYTLHLEGLGLAPDLLALYQEMDRQGRARLPALRAGQALGWANGEAVGVAIRDNGTFLDPRSRKDWWQGF